MEEWEAHLLEVWAEPHSEEWALEPKLKQTQDHQGKNSQHNYSKLKKWDFMMKKLFFRYSNKLMVMSILHLKFYSLLLEITDFIMFR